MTDPTSRAADDARLAERLRCVAELKAMAREAERSPAGISYEGGIRADHAARILFAAAREIEAAGAIHVKAKVPLALDAPDAKP